MEVAGLAISIVGLASLCDTCVSLIEKLESYHRSEKEKAPLLNQLQANRLILLDWSRQVGISSDADSLDQLPALDGDRREIVHNILSDLRKILSSPTSGDLSQGARPKNHVRSSPKIQDSRAQTGTKLKSSLVARPPASPSHYGKFKWAFGRGKSKLQEQVQLSSDLIEKLCRLMSPENQYDSRLSMLPEVDLRDRPWLSTIDKLRVSSTEPSKVRRRPTRTHLDLSPQDLVALRVLKSGAIREWLSVAPFEDLYRKRLSERQAETCSWILKHDAYTKWLSKDGSTKSRLFWLHGPGGCGKSVLCAYVVNEMLTTDAEIGHFFCTSNKKEQKDVSTIVNTFVWQLAKYNDAIFGDLLRWFEIISPRKPPEDDVWAFFKEAIKRVSAPILFIDGLDECRKTSTEWREGSDSVRAAFLTLLATCIKDCNVRVIVFSREEADISEGILHFEHNGCDLYTHKITVSDVQSDLKLFAQHTVQSRLEKKPSEVKNEITERIVSRSDGMFLWIKLQEHNLQSTKNKQQLIRMIEEMPQGIENLFSRDWEQIQKLQKREMERALMILLWLTFAVRPLTVAELTEALAILDEDSLPDLIDDEYVRNEILGICASLITAEEVSGKLCDESIVTFSHFSAKSFAQKVLSDPLTHDSMVLDESLLAQLCVKYLMEEATWRPAETADSGSSSAAFLNYAAEFWRDHFPDVISDESKASDIINEFFSRKNEFWPRWRDMYETLERQKTEELTTNTDESGGCALERQQTEELTTDMYEPGGHEYYSAYFHLLPTMKYIDRENDCDWNSEGGLLGSPLQAACTYAFSEPIEFLLQRNVNVNQAGGLFGSALNATAAEGTLDTARRLIEMGADLDIRDESDSSALHFAACRGDSEVVKLLLGHGINICITDKFGTTPLHQSAYFGQVKVVEALLDAGANIDIPDDEGDTPLEGAAWWGHDKVVEVLRDRGANINATNNIGETPLHSAAERGHVRIVEYLLSQGAEIDVRSEDGWTPFGFAISSGEAKVAELLLDRGADPRINDGDWNPLRYMVTGGHIQTARLLLDRKVDMYITDKSGRTVLLWAAQDGQVEMVKLLLDWGVDINTTDKTGRNALLLAARDGQVEMAKLLLDRGVDINTTDKTGRNALLLAARDGQVEMTRLLLDRKAEINGVNNSGKSPLSSAAEYGHLEVVKLLLDRKAEINGVNNSGKSPLLSAAKYGHLEVVKLLLDRKAEINGVNNLGRGVLSNAAKRGHLEVVKLILGQDTKLDDRKHQISYALEKASEYGRNEVVKFLLNEDVDVHRSGRDGVICDALLLRNAIRLGHLDTVDILTTHGCKTSSIDWAGRTSLHTPIHVDSMILLEKEARTTELAARSDDLGCNMLHYAARSNCTEALRWAVNAGVELDKADHQGWTPLHWAAYFQQASSVECLLDLGASPSTQDCRGRCPGDISVLVGANEVTKLLVEHLGQKTGDSSYSTLPRLTGHCDDCFQKFYGDQYHCTTCGFDLCFRCFMDRDILHPVSHEFVDDFRYPD